MATITLPKVLANFETGLSTKISDSASSLTIDTSVDNDGNALSGLYQITIDEGISSEEHMLVTFTGASGTITRRGLSRVDFWTEQTANKFAHDRGASVKITNFSIGSVFRLLNGTDTFNSVNLSGIASISGLSLPTSGETTKAASVQYVNNIAISGAPDATTTVKGISEEATQAEIDADTAVGGTGARLFTNPSTLVTSKYGVRLPTSEQKDALTGNGGTVGSANTYVTQTGYQEGTEIFGASSSGNDTYAVTLSPVPAAYTNGMRVWLRPDTSNTGACTLNVNGLGAVNIKISGDDPQTNSIIAGQTYCFVYNSTGPVFELETTPDVLVAGSSSDASGYHTHKGVITVSNGATTRGGGATGTQTITHNLNVVPRSIEIKVVRKMSTNQAGSSLGFYDAGGQNCIGWNGTTTSPVVSANTSRVAYNLNQSSQVDWEGTLQNVTTTQFDISWATIRSDGGSGDLQILWRAIA